MDIKLKIEKAEKKEKKMMRKKKLTEVNVACENALKNSKETQKINNEKLRKETEAKPEVINVGILGSAFIDEIDFYNSDELKAIANEIKSKVVSYDLKKLYLCGQIFKNDLVNKKESLALEIFLSLLEYSRLEIIIGDEDIETKYAPKPLRSNYNLNFDDFGTLMIVMGENIHNFRLRRPYLSRTIRYTRKSFPKYERQSPFFALVGEKDRKDDEIEKLNREIYIEVGNDNRVDRVLNSLENTYITIIFDTTADKERFEKTHTRILSKFTRINLVVEEK